MTSGPLGAHFPCSSSELLMWPRPRGQCGLWVLCHVKVIASYCADLGASDGQEARGRAAAPACRASVPSYPVSFPHRLGRCFTFAADHPGHFVCSLSVKPPCFSTQEMWMMLCKQLLQRTRERRPHLKAPEGEASYNENYCPVLSPLVSLEFCLAMEMMY